jgi:Raf kinase inhibitor-like YbhB/YbcL family protein
MRTLVVSLLMLAIPIAALAQPEPLEVTSPAFPANGPIPADFTCQGKDISPPLAWSQVPPETRSIAILVDDPDAPRGTVTHFLVTNLPPQTQSLRAGTALPPGAIATKNDLGNAGWAGPCPPSGRHRYRFQVFALDTTLPRPASRAQFLAAIKGHVVAEGQLVGTYQKR